MQAKGIKEPKPRKFTVTLGVVQAAHKEYHFPLGFYCTDWPMVETTFVDTGEVRIDYQGAPHATREQVDAYVAEFCKLNHLRGS